MSTYHTFVLNATSKERRHQVLFPLIKNAIENGESFLATDSGGTLVSYLNESLLEEGYKICYLDFMNMNANWKWNPLQYPYQLYKSGQYDKCIEQVNALASVIMERNSSTNQSDPFWSNTAADLFVALVLSIYKNGSPQEVNLQSILNMLIEGNQSYGGSTFIQEYFSLEECKEFYKIGAAFLNSPSETRASISSVFIQGLRNVLGSELLNRHLYVDTLNIQRIPSNKTAVIINISESASYTTLVGVLINQITYALYKRTSVIGGSKVVKPFHFFLDRFVSLSRMPQIERMLAHSFDFNISYVFLADSIAVLESVYGVDIAKAIMEYCERWVIFPTRNKRILKELVIIFDTYATDRRKDIIEVLNSNMPIVLDENQKIGPYSLLDESIFAYKLYPINDKSFPVSEPMLFSIKDFTHKKKLKVLINNINSEETKHNSISDKRDIDFNIDDLIKKIDEKIAEIEAQEKEGSINIHS